MKTILFTAFDEKYKPLAELTIPLMWDYAVLNGWHFHYVAEPMIKTQDGIYWTKFLAALEHLKTHERYIWLDIDQMITNPKASLNVAPIGFHVSRDWGFDAKDWWCFSVCGFIAHQDCIPLFEEVLKLEPKSRGKPFPEQQPMRDLIKKKRDQAWMLHPPRFLNAVPNEVCSGKVVDPWRLGDFAAHLTMLPVRERIELFHQVKQQAGI